MEGAAKVYIPDESFGWVAATLLRVDRAAGTCAVEVEADEAFGMAGGEARTVSLAHPLLQTCRGEAAGAAGGTGDEASLPLQNLQVPEEGVEDMAALSFLHEPAILFNLRRRFLAKQPYTYTGEICISVNPYQWIDGLYSEQLKEAYFLTDDLQALPPHVFAVSAAAYRGLRDKGEDQSILVSGESGSGKTEATKLMMSHLASISGGGGGSHGNDDGDASGSGTEGGDRTIERVLEANPLLESFGNAKTVRNDNSSRFGRFTQLQFHDPHPHHQPQPQQQRSNGGGRPQPQQLVGSECVTYLLEKSRVVHHSMGERTYHIFYQLLAAPEADRAAVGLGGKGVGDFRYLSCDHGGSDTTVIEGRSDAERYQATRRALGLIGVGEELQRQVLAALAGILYLGQVDFVGEEGAGDEEARVKEEGGEDGGEGGALADAARLLGCDAAALGTAMCSRTVRTRHESYAVPMTPGQAADAREALSKEVYARLFAWLVARINGSTAVDAGGLAAGGAEEASALRTIGLLDIFGFESFAVNRFEQLCINYCNERLQQRFTTDVFKSVQEEYDAEGIAWQFVAFPDNTPVLELIEGRMGLITVLNEECMLAKGGDATFTSKLTSLHEEHPHFAKDRLNRLDFSIHHYAGTVRYTAANFVARNRDTLLEDLSAALGQSRLPLVQELFPPPDVASPGPGDASSHKRKGAGTIAAESVVTKFRRQLTDLMATVAATRVQYIRCIKPNQGKSPSALEPQMVTEQLRCAGVIEAIRISRAAYPNRLGLAECLRRFRLLHVARGDQEAAGRALCKHSDDGDGAGAAVAAAVRRLLGELLPEEAEAEGKGKANGKEEGDGEKKPRRQRWEMGRTRVYFAKGALEELEEKRLGVLAANATTVQRCYRGARQRAAYHQQRRAAIVVESRVRGWRQRRWYARERRRVVQLQALWRRRRDARAVHELRLRMRATTIQTAFRRHLHQGRYRRAREGTVRVQALARGRAARAAYVVALAEAREQAKLENQLESLKRRLEEESAARRAAEERLAQEQQAAAAAGGGGGGGGEQQVAQPGAAGSGTGAGAAADPALLAEQGQWLDLLRGKVIKYRKESQAFRLELQAYKREAEVLRTENQRLKDAHAGAALSFSSLNQHAANVQRVNKRLQREAEGLRAEAQRMEQAGLRELHRVREEAGRHADKLGSQLQRAREELRGKQQLCELEMQMRLKQDRTMERMINIVQRRAGERDPELVEELVEMRHACSVGVLEDVASRSSLIGGLSSNMEDGSPGASVKARATKLFTGLAQQFMGGAGEGGGGP